MSRNKSSQFDEQLKTAYEQAVYRIFTPALYWKIGDQLPQIDTLLQDHSVNSAIFITACNPFSQLCTPAENQQKTAALALWLDQQGLTAISGQGEDPNGVWPPEHSFLILGVNAQEGKLLGRQWQQNAVVQLRAGQPVKLLWCDDQ